MSLTPQEERVESILGWIADQMQRFPDVRRVILFGSRARRDNVERSDIDLAVEAPAASTRTWSDIEEIIENAPTLIEIDVVRLEQAPPELAERVFRYGRTIYDRTAQVEAGELQPNAQTL